MGPEALVLTAARRPSLHTDPVAPASPQAGATDRVAISPPPTATA